MKNPKALSLLKKEGLKIKALFSHPTFLFLTIVGNGILLICTLILYWLEKGVNPNIHNYFDALWWGIATITTVAYGDIVPVTTAGRLVGIVLIYTGTVLFVTFTGVLLGFIMWEEVEKEVEPFEREVKREGVELERIEKKLDDLIKRIEKIEQ